MKDSFSVATKTWCKEGRATLDNVSNFCASRCICILEVVYVVWLKSQINSRLCRCGLIDSHFVHCLISVHAHSLVHVHVLYILVRTPLTCEPHYKLPCMQYLATVFIALCYSRGTNSCWKLNMKPRQSWTRTVKMALPRSTSKQFQRQMKALLCGRKKYHAWCATFQFVFLIFLTAKRMYLQPHFIVF